MTRVSVVIVLAAVLPAVSAPAFAQVNEVTGVSHQARDNAMVFTVTTSGEVGEPRVFATENPPRVVVELADTASELPAQPIPVGGGIARSYTTLSAGGRTRLIVDLDHSAPYQIEYAGREVRLTISSPRRAAVAATTAPPAAIETAAGRPAGGGAITLTDIDFRRGDGGESRVVLKLSGGGVSLAVNEHPEQLLVELYNVTVPENLGRSLDVSDFATPVKRISSVQRGGNAQFNLQISGAYRHLAYQSGDDVVIEVSRPPVEERREPELQFFQERTYSGERVTFNFQDIPVRSVLQLIADVSNLNVVVADSVQGNVTLRLTNVPWDQALDIILDTKNLDKRQNGNVIWIAPAEEIASREQQMLRAAQEKRTLEPLQTVLLDISYANAPELKELIESAGSGGADQGLLSERGSVSVDERTNTLLITDTAERIVQVQKLIRELDRPVRQVLIESRIVIARNTFGYELGTRFGITVVDEGDKGNVFSTSGSLGATDAINNVALTNRLLNGSGGTSQPTAVPDDLGAGILVPALQDRLNVNLPTVTSPAGRFGFSILAADYLLDLEISALETEGNGEVISMPRVITANQAEAFIQQGVEIPFEESTSSGASSVEFKEAVLELRVTPLITPDDRVQMSVSVKQDTVGEIFPTAQGGQVPSIDTRELSTRVLIENGQTVVLGGIFQDDRNFDTTKVPFLGDIPILGNLFRRRVTSDEKRELLIFITPTILDERAIFN